MAAHSGHAEVWLILLWEGVVIGFWIFGSFLL